MAMQYPTLPVAALENYLDDPRFQGVEIVGNEANFRQALRERNYEEVFVDRFGGGWGHTTFFGHGLLAAAAAEKIKGLVEREEKFSSFRPSPRRSSSGN